MSLIPPHYLNSVVSIEVESKDNNGLLQKNSIATGFLVGKPTGKSNEGGALFRLFIVTNRHVYQNKKTKEFLKEVFFRFNTLDNKSHYFKVNLLKSDGCPLWLMHEDERVDLAVLPINATAIDEAKINYDFFVGEELFYAKDFATKNISTGDGLFVLGFPMRISGKARNFVIVRQGIIARVDEEVLGEGFFYIDASAYPGNSGGPVIHKPELLAIAGTQSNPSAGLIGVVSSGENYSDVAISQQTGEPRIIFTEQTGLVRVVPIELIFEIIDKIPLPQKTEEAKVQDVGSEK
ncbi:MAG: serine protease [Candidatus Moranbacteria bacterium]|nr:serine protease [Candidatus Moranbacteria bacterium]